MSSKLFILVLLAIAGTIVKADPVAITWSGAPVVTTINCPGCPYGPIEPDATAVQDGANAGLSVGYYSSAWGPNPFTSSTIEIPFTIAAPADVEIALTLDYSAEGTSCGDFNCNAQFNAWTFSGGFSGSISIQGAGFSVPFAASGSVAAYCDVGVECSAGYYSAPLTLSDSESGMVDLANGTYDLVVNYSDFDNSIGDSEATSRLEALISDPVSPVPEPRYSVYGMIYVILMILFRRRFSRRSIKV